MALQRRTRSTRMLVVTLVTASLVTITVDYRQGSSGPLAEIGNAALSVITPMQEAVSKAFRPVSKFFSSLAELPSLRDERDRLRDEVARLKQEITGIEALRAGNDELRALLHMKQTLLFDLKTLGANVIGNSVSNFEWSITIDVGSNDGVRLDDAVIAAEGLIGHVVEVTPMASKVQLIIDPDSQVAARLVVSGQAGLMSGRGNQDLGMDLVEVGTPIADNEAVQTAGYRVQGVGTGIYPRGIPIGTVASSSDSPSELTKNITVHPAVDFSTLDVVLVVLGPGKS